MAVAVFECEQVTANCPPELKKYLAASPLANVTVCVTTSLSLQVDSVLTTEFAVVVLCVAALNLLEYIASKLVTNGVKYAIVSSSEGGAIVVMLVP
jgi:ribosomal protein L30E